MDFVGAGGKAGDAGKDVIRYRVDRFTPNCAAISCKGTSFERSNVRIVFSSLGLSFFGRPPLRPRARAAFKPASVRSRISEMPRRCSPNWAIRGF